MTTLTHTKSTLEFLKPFRTWGLWLRSGVEICNTFQGNISDEVLASFVRSHSTDLEISTVWTNEYDAPVAGKVCQSFIGGFAALAIRTTYTTPDLISLLEKFRLTPSWVSKRGQVLEAVWRFPKSHTVHEKLARENHLQYLPLAEYQTIRKNLCVELGIEPIGDGFWMFAPGDGENVFRSNLPYDAVELHTPNVINPIREALVKLADVGILVGCESASHPDRCYSHALLPYLKSFPGLAAETDKKLAQMLREHGVDEWRTAAANGHKFPQLTEFRKTLACRYGHMKWTNDRRAWSTI